MTQRVIKFRAWVHDAIYEDVFFIKSNNRLYDIYQNNNGIVKHVCTCDKDILTIMQFTGLLDKHGKEIYEHDIMALKDASGKIKYLYVVKFEDAKFVLYHLNNDYGNWGNLHRAFEHFRDYEFCIVGNIYTNPELIER